MKQLALALLGLLLAGVGRAADPARWTVDDVILAESATGFQCSPDGRWAVWVKTVPDREKNEQVGNLVRTDLVSGRETVLTRGSEGCSSPRWSPDGKLVAFLSARSAARGKAGSEDESKNQLWVIDPFGGEPWPLTDSDRGVVQYDWAGPNALLFAAQERPSHLETRLKDQKDTTTAVEDERYEPPVRLFRVEVGSKKITRLTDNRDWIEDLAVSPDGRHVVAIHNRSLHYAYDNRVKPVLFLHDLATGRRRPVLDDPGLNISHIRWAPDGRGFYATNEHNSHPPLAQAGVTELYYYDLDRGKSTRIDLGWDNGLALQEENEDAPGFAVTRDGFVALLANGVRNRAARYTRAGTGWQRAWLEGEHSGHLFGLEVSADGQVLLYAHSGASTPTQWYRAELRGAHLEKPVALARLNENLGQRRRARTEVVRWPGAFGEEVEGILYYPHDYRPGSRYPLVVMIHGGPASADLDSWTEWWMYPTNLVCQRGAFVLKPNYHGSSNYGLKWLESITAGRYGGPELVDIEKGVDALVARGLADPDRLGLFGWSNGAILANFLTARTTRYKVACAGAGSVEYVSDWANCEFGDAFDRYYLGKSPLADPRLYHRKSPFYCLERVRTPTLISFGTEDRRVATEQGWVQYRGLQQLGQAPVRFLLFPGEKHVLKKLAHQRRKVEEELAWLDRYLFHSPHHPNEALKADSPLAWALKRARARRAGPHYGLLDQGRLIPETVRHGSLEVGRFEVTAAQFAQFDAQYRSEPGHEDYPAHGIRFEQARDYCAWLSKATGQRYRLPTAEEADILYPQSQSGDNTLDRWAGYAVNPDDAVRLRARARELGGTAPLLQAVGSGLGIGDGELVFDLGGNVAEWVTTKDGKGVLRGGSADTPADPRGGSVEAAPEYRGFRVIKEGAPQGRR